MQNTINSSNKVPLVSIGVPVFNGEKTLVAALESLTKQSFNNIEIIISDNASTDSTQTICEKFAEKDSRVNYIRQEKNIGSAKNFEFVFKKSYGKYFMWAAADDIRSDNFINENINFLEKNTDYSASTSPNCFEKKSSMSTKKIIFSLEGSIENRFDVFLKNAWVSHGIFYALMRTQILNKYPLHGKHFLAADWALDIFMASEGKIHRTGKGLMTSGVFGVSNNKNPWQPFRTNIICWIFPFYKFSSYLLKLSSETPFLWKARLGIRLLNLNLCAAKNQLVAEFYPLYSSYLKPLLEKMDRD